MQEAIAKRYVKALVKSFDGKELDKISENLRQIASAFGIRKFYDIVNSIDISENEKEKFLLSLVKEDSPKFKNFLKLIVSHNRILEIPAISKELQKAIALQKGQFEGEIISNFDINTKEVSQLEKQISKKLGKKIKLEPKKSDYPGLKIEVDDLGVELGLSTKRVKEQLAEHILKAL